MTVIPMDMPKPAPNEPKGLDDEDLRAIIETEIREALNGEDSQIALDQERALEYYEGRPFGNEVEGSSSVVLSDVRETVDWALPALMRAFFYTNEIVRYEDTTPDSEQAGHGRRMTQVVNEIFRNQLGGFRIVYDWAKAGMLERFAAVKFWVEHVREPMIESGTLTAEQLVLLSQQPDVELFEASDRLQVITDPAGMPIDQVEVYDVRWKRWKTTPRLRLETVPPEEFLITRRALRLDQEVTFVAHRARRTRSDLYSLNIPWDLVASLPPAPSRGDLDGRKTSRDERDAPDFSASTRKDKASQEVTVTESYIRVDYDGDGYSELRRVLSGGDGTQVILDHDYAPMHGFAGWTPIPMPHKLYGLGYADIVGDLQLQRSTVLRQLLDNNYRMNNARHVLVEGDVDLDSYLDANPGAPVIVQRSDAVEPLPVPALPSWAFELLTYLEKVREQRTGIHPYSQEVYAAGQNQTAQGVSTVFEAAMAQIQLLAQNFAESGLIQLFRVIPRMMKAAGIGPGRIRVGSEWIDYNPQEWPDDMRVSVQVGLSPGQTEQRIQRLMLLMGLQKEALAAFGPGYMVTPEQIYQTAVSVVEQGGFQNPDRFFSNPAGKEMPQQPPSPDEVKVQVEAKDKQAQAALQLAKLEFDKEKERAQDARLREDAKLAHERELANIAATERAQRYTADRQYEAALLQQQAQLAEAKAAATATATAEAEKAGDTSRIDAALRDLTARLEALERPVPAAEGA